MHIVLLAAGRGSRMGARTSDRPKPLVELSSGCTIVDVASGIYMQQNNVERLIIVGGYMFEKWQAFKEASPYSDRITLINNKDYAQFGPMYSVALGVAEIASSVGSIAITNGDTIIKKGAMARIQACAPKNGFYICASRVTNPDPDDVVLTIDADSRVLAATKQLSPLNPVLVSAGFIGATGEENCAKLKLAVLGALMNGAASNQSQPWHGIVRKIAEGGNRIEAIEIDRLDWREFDDEHEVIRHGADITL